MSNPTSFIEIENQLLSIGREFLPPEGRILLDGVRRLTDAEETRWRAWCEAQASLMDDEG